MQIQQPTADWLSTSWQRSSQAGLRQRCLPDDVRLSSAELKSRLWRATNLIDAVEHIALPMFRQMFARTDSRLILTDHEGVILATWGQPRFSERLTEIALESGVCWQEQTKGTNAIGTALVETRPVTIIGQQHYIRQHHFISCSASPLFNHKGELLGILDITSEQQEHDLSTQVLVQNMVQLIENQLLSSIPQGATRINLAFDPSLLRSGWQGIVIADESGRVLAHNHIASQLLARMDVIGQPIDDLLESRRQSFVYEKEPLQNTVKMSKTLSSSDGLHYGDRQIEQAWQQAVRLTGKDVGFLILGETGVGKGEFVKALHRHSSRQPQPLVSVNCGALPKDLIESELFGYAPGAFTGASSKGYEGKIRQADGGILFLDEIADLPLEAQSRLLHVIQDKVVIPVGSNQSHGVSLQIIAATHKDIPQLVEQGQFRQDLYYRLNGLVITLPALRQREDKEELIRHIHAKYRPAGQSLSPHLCTMLQEYGWPGHIRELDNLMKVSCLLSGDDPALRLEHIPAHLAGQLSRPPEHNAPSDRDSQDLKAAMEAKLIRTYQATDRNVTQTSRLLGISRNTIYRKLRALGMMK